MTKKSSGLKFNSFFAGIGGFDVAFEANDFEPAFQCEIDEFCRTVLRKHWPQVRLYDDINTLNPSDIPDADVWCGGFPCQDLSVARGSKSRDGLRGKNSGLFYPFAELIKEKLPTALLIENVTGLLTSHNGQDFRIILETLSRFGYSIAWRVMNSRYFGSPQSRPRVFICATLDNSTSAISTLYESEAGIRPKNQRLGFLTPHRCDSTGAQVAEVAYCLAATSGRHTGTDWSRTYVSYEDQVRRLTPTECEGLQGFPQGWTEGKCSKTNELLDLDNARYRALGNAVSVPVVSWIAERLEFQLKKKAGSKLVRPIEGFEGFEDFASSGTRRIKLSELYLSTKADGCRLKWQSGGFVQGDDCWDIRAPEAPSKPRQKNLIDVIEKRHPESRYYISPNAAEGILRRVTSQNRKLFEPMHKALEKLAVKSPA
jgi:DNA (cytosine-5)-methyltransferase 1